MKDGKPQSVACSHTFRQNMIHNADMSRSSLQGKVEHEANIAPSIANEVIVEKIAIDTVEAEHDYTAAEYRRLLWKIDLWLLPLVSENPRCRTCVASHVAR